MLTYTFAKKNENQSDDKKYVNMITYIIATKQSMIGLGLVGRAGQGRAGQCSAGQDMTGQGRAGQGRAGQESVGQGRAGQTDKLGCVCSRVG